MSNRSFYNEILTEHNLRPEHKHDLPCANCSLDGVNPSCGDEITHLRCGYFFASFRENISRSVTVFQYFCHGCFYSIRFFVQIQ